MEEEKEVSVEKEIKDRANKIAAHLSNDNNVISLRGDHRTFVLSSFLRKLGSEFCSSYSWNFFPLFHPISSLILRNDSFQILKRLILISLLLYSYIRLSW